MAVLFRNESLSLSPPPPNRHPVIPDKTNRPPDGLHRRCHFLEVAAVLSWENWRNLRSGSRSAPNTRCRTAAAYHGLYTCPSAAAGGRQRCVHPARPPSVCDPAAAACHMPPAAATGRRFRTWPAVDAASPNRRLEYAPPPARTPLYRNARDCCHHHHYRRRRRAPSSPGRSALGCDRRRANTG